MGRNQAIDIHRIILLRIRFGAAFAARFLKCV